MGRKKEKWIPKNLDEGALTNAMERKYGKKAFTKAGTLRVSLIKKEAKANGKEGQRARFALKARKFKH